MKRTKEDAEQTRENILNAAIGLFADKGVTATTLEDIAAAAHVTRGAIYWHFKNKLEIFDALHERLHRPLVTMIMEDVEKTTPNRWNSSRPFASIFYRSLKTTFRNGRRSRFS